MTRPNGPLLVGIISREGCPARLENCFAGERKLRVGALLRAVMKILYIMTLLTNPALVGEWQISSY